MDESGRRPHTLVADDASFRSSGLQLNQTFSQTFSTPGTYPYHCSIHPFMQGKVVVQ
jgi:plastocyanin